MGCDRCVSFVIAPSSYSFVYVHFLSLSGHDCFLCLASADCVFRIVSLKGPAVQSILSKEGSNKAEGFTATRNARMEELLQHGTLPRHAT